MGEGSGPEDIPATTGSHLPVSVIVPAFNGAADLDRCLQAIGQSSGPMFECIVVDDASTDADVRRVAERHAVRYERLSGRSGPAVARNTGAAKAAGRILFFTDADVELHADAISQAISLLDAEPDVAAVIGSYDDDPGHPGLLSQYRNLYHHWTHQSGSAEAWTFWTGCGAIRRESFEQLGGFSADFQQPSIEDIELGWRARTAGFRIRLLKTMQGKHLKRWRFWDMVRTDIFRRGAPWVALLFRQGSVQSDLNLDRRARIATLAAALVPVSCLVLVLLGQATALAPTIAVLLSAAVGSMLTDVSPTAENGARSGSRWKSHLSALIGAALLLLSLAWLPNTWGLLPLALIAVVVWVQQDFYRLLIRRGGMGFALAVVPLQLVFFIGCAVSVPMGFLEYMRQRRRRQD